MSAKPYDIVVIGSGPAGITAAIYGVRANLKTLVIAGNLAGGQLTLTTDVEDFPGFVEPIRGPILMEQMRKQAERLNVEFMNEHVTKVDFKKRPFTVWMDKKSVQGSTVIISTGGDFKLLGLDSERRLLGRGLSTCAVCDAFFFKDKDVAVVGGGDTAMREALYLANVCKSVTVIHRRDKLKAQPVLQDRAFANKKIKFLWNTEVQEVLGDKLANGLRLINNVTKKATDMPFGGIFIAIGHKPNTELFKGQINIDSKGYIVLKGTGQETSVPGVYAAGDVHDYVYMQAVTAAGAGCRAALDAYRFLKEEGKK